jgi:hypothetical protein
MAKPVMTKAGRESYRKWCENIRQAKRVKRANDAILRRVPRSLKRST